MAVSCGNNQKSQREAQNEKVESAPDNDDFMTFYDRFGTDSLFQVQHIIFPLEGMKSVTDTIEIVNPDFRWQREDWVVHGPFDDMDGTFVREFIAAKDIVVENIHDNSGTFSMERRFAKMSSGWNLIYYREMGRY